VQKIRRFKKTKNDRNDDMKQICRIFMVFSLCSATVLPYSCGRVSTPSSTEEVVIVNESGVQTVVWMEDEIVFSKICADAAEAATRECKSVEEPKATAYAVFFRSLALSQGVPSAYADYRGKARLERDIASTELVLSQSQQTPQERSLAEERLNRLNDANYRIGKVIRLIVNIQSKDHSSYAQGVNEMYDPITNALSQDLRLWKDRVNKQYWTILPVAMNWYDAMGLPRIVDQFGMPSDPIQQGCAERLGDGWRVPSVNESNASYQAGLRRMPNIRLANPFWTSDDSESGTTTEAMAFSVEVPVTQLRPKYQQVFTVCVHAAQ
jgi:hypothetical protein